MTCHTTEVEVGERWKENKKKLIFELIPLKQALPMVTLIVGKRREGQTSIVNIATYCDGADDPKRVEFDLKCLEPGTPK